MRAADIQRKTRQDRQRGMTLVELGFVIAIFSVLMALVLGLSRHVDEVTKVRRAQAELGEWHETLERWFLQFGQYPHGIVRNGMESELLAKTDSEVEALASLTNVYEHAYIEIMYGTDNNVSSNVYFNTYATTKLKALDPWGTPYIYVCDEAAMAYTLFSCGRDQRSVLGDGTVLGGSVGNRDTTLDDVYFVR